jgi:S-adenosylmethionine-diacylglycerol 3-amino-3-carboxypropyl transferase
MRVAYGQINYLMIDAMKNKDQVALSQLIFSLNWEDPASDLQALRIKPGDKVMAITSGCCNALEFLLHDPEQVYTLDINPAQTYLMELKTAAIKHLSFESYRDLMGLSSTTDRSDIYASLRSHLSPGAREFWDEQGKIIRKGLVMSGRYENFVRLAGWAIRFLQGRKRVLRLFQEKSLEEQQRYFDEVFNTRRFRAIFPLLFNKRMLARKGLNADYFHFHDGSSSFAESFYNRARHAMRDLPIKGNYFLALYLQGQYNSPEEVPEYLKPENFSTLKERIDRITLITDDAKEWLMRMPDSTIDCFSLSNICELKSENDTDLLFREISRVGKNGGRCCFRNLMIPREVPVGLSPIVQKDEQLSHKMMAEDRSFVYGKVAAYQIRKVQAEQKPAMQAQDDSSFSQPSTPVN